jgi:hypothetical protein
MGETLLPLVREPGQEDGPCSAADHHCHLITTGGYGNIM